MANSFTIPPILQEFDHFISACKKMNADLQRASARLTELEVDLAKEKAERRNLQNNSHRKVEELNAQNESLRSDLQKSLKVHQEESNQIRSMLVSAQHEHKSVLKIIQDELDRTKQAFRNENQGRTEALAALQKLNTDHASLHEAKAKDFESLKRLSTQLKTASDEIAHLKKVSQKLQDDYVRAIESAGKAEELLRGREQEFRKKLHSVESSAKAETDSKQWLNTMFMKLQHDYEKLGKQLQQEQETAKRIKADSDSQHHEFQKALKAAGHRKAAVTEEFQMTERALRTRDDEVIRLQEQLIKAKRNIHDTDEARKAAQALANQLRADLDVARNELVKRRTEHPLHALLASKEMEIHEISNQLSAIQETHPDHSDLSALLDSCVQQRAYFEQLLNDAIENGEKITENKPNPHIY